MKKIINKIATIAAIAAVIFLAFTSPYVINHNVQSAPKIILGIAAGFIFVAAYTQEKESAK